MQLCTYTSAGAFLDEVRVDLERREAENSLILGIALRLERTPLSGAGCFLGTVTGQDGWHIAALMTPPHPLVLAGSGEVSAEALPVLARHLDSGQIAVSGVVGPAELARGFADEWTRNREHTISRTVRQRVYRLTKVAPLPAKSGQLRRATPHDLDLAGHWMARFQAEALNDHNAEQALRGAEGRIGAGELYLWDDSGPRCMVARSRPTRNTASINSVYTPPEWRCQGLATAAVAALSQKLIDEGYAMCVLFTNLANPTSNSIYCRIGYEPVRDFAHIHFGCP